MLEKVTSGKIKQPHLVLIYGVDTSGKTTFGASAPKPIIIGPESGSANIDVTRLEVKSYAETMQTIEELRTDKHPYETAVIDSLDWLEPLVWTAVCEAGNMKSIEDFGYGKGYVIANGYWQKMIAALKALREERKMNIVLIAHSHVKAFNDPAQLAPYDRYSLKLNDKAAALWREFVDSVLFATFEVFVKKDGLKSRAYGDGARISYTERRPGFDAKNRFGLPFQIPTSWEEYEKAVANSHPDDPNVLRESILNLLSEIKDEALKAAVIGAVEKAGDVSARLEAIKTRLLVRLGE